MRAHAGALLHPPRVERQRSRETPLPHGGRGVQLPAVGCCGGWRVRGAPVASLAGRGWRAIDAVPGPAPERSHNTLQTVPRAALSRRLWRSGRGGQQVPLHPMGRAWRHRQVGPLDGLACCDRASWIWIRALRLGGRGCRRNPPPSSSVGDQIPHGTGIRDGLRRSSETPASRRSRMSQSKNQPSIRP